MGIEIEVGKAVWQKATKEWMVPLIFQGHCTGHFGYGDTIKEATTEAMKQVPEVIKTIKGTIKGKVKLDSGMIFSWTLKPDNTLNVSGLVVSAKNVTHSDQVIRLIDNEISEVKEYQIENGEWMKYR